MSVLLFSEGNMPFIATDARYFTGDGTLSAMASARSMNALLEHWAHGDSSADAVHRLCGPHHSVRLRHCGAHRQRRFHGMGEPLDALPHVLVAAFGRRHRAGRRVAYVVLGWGGYWGWDPVENASLLPWLVGVALIHSFTVYRQRGAFKRWACSAPA